MKIVKPETTAAYPGSLNTAAKCALYDNLEQKETLALALDAKIKSIKKDNWRGNRIKEREVEIGVKGILAENGIDSPAVFKCIMDLIKNQGEY